MIRPEILPEEGGLSFEETSVLSGSYGERTAAKTANQEDNDHQDQPCNRQSVLFEVSPEDAFSLFHLFIRAAAFRERACILTPGEALR